MREQRKTITREENLRRSLISLIGRCLATFTRKNIKKKIIRKNEFSKYLSRFNEFNYWNRAHIIIDSLTKSKLFLYRKFDERPM